MKKKYSIYFIVLLLFIYMIPNKSVNASKILGTLHIENVKNGDRFTLIQTHTFSENGEFVKLSDPFIIEKNTTNVSFENLKLGIYDLKIGDNIETYTFKLPDFTLRNPYEKTIILKHGELTLEKLLGKNKSDLNHHHINDDLMIDKLEKFYYGLKLNIPKEFNSDTYKNITIEDEYPNILKLNENGILVYFGDGTELKKDTDYLMENNNGKLIIRFTKSGLEKFPKGSYLTVRFEVSLKREEQDKIHLNIPNTANLKFDYKEKHQIIESEKEYFSTKTKSILIKKVDSKSFSNLVGAKFSLIFEDKKIATNVSDKNGELYFTILKSGKYKIIEEEAPKNYRKLSYSIDIIVQDKDNEVSITVKNEKMNTKLPETGENDKLLYYGLVLIIISILLYEESAYEKTF